eukprot:865712_1
MDFKCVDFSGLNYHDTLQSIENFNKKWFLDTRVPLGSGGQGAVFACYRLSNSTKNNKYCCKILQFCADTRLKVVHLALSEYKMVKKCTALIRYKGIYLDDTHQQILLVMHRLTTALDAADKTAAPDVSDVLYGVCSKIKAMHSNGYAHLDLKPGNIMFCPRETMWVPIDFSLARRVADDRFHVIGGAYATPGWTAPEISISRRPDHSSYLGKASDIYALGLLILNLLNGGGPWAHWIAISGTKWSDNHFYYLRTKAGHQDIAHYVQDLHLDHRIDYKLYRLLTKMLSFDPHMRPSVRRVFEYFFEAQYDAKWCPPNASPVDNSHNTALPDTDKAGQKTDKCVKDYFLNALGWIFQ